MYPLNWNLRKFGFALLSMFMVCKHVFVHSVTGLLTGLNTTVIKVIA